MSVNLSPEQLNLLISAVNMNYFLKLSLGAVLRSGEPVNEAFISYMEKAFHDQRDDLTALAGDYAELLVERAEPLTR